MCKAINNCIQKDICHRYNATPEQNDQAYIRFHNLCFLENNFQWFYGDRSKMIKPELIPDIVKEEGE